MKRRLFTLFAALSLLGCAAVCTAWVRSYATTDWLYWHGVWDEGDRSYHRQTVVALGQGGAGLSWSVRSGDRYAPIPGGDGRTYRQVAEQVDIPFHRVQRPRYPEFWTRRGVKSDWHGFQYDFYDWPNPDPRRRRTSHSWKVVVPCWSLALATAALPAAWASNGLWRLRRRRRTRRGLCPACGYDLRATPERCPECGAASATGQLTGATAEEVGA